MATNNGVIYVAYGLPARNEAIESIKTLRQHNDLPVAVISDSPIGGTQHIYMKDSDKGGRMAKLSIDSLSPFDHMLYLDADTRVNGDITKPFDILADGWDLAICHSIRQGEDVLGNIEPADRVLTAGTIGTANALGLQAGVIYIRKSERISRLFKAWREEWQRFKTMDQGALLRALAKEPVNIWLLGRTYNGGGKSLIEHRFGMARR